MTIVHAKFSGNKVVLPREDFERLVNLARQSEPVELEYSEDDLPIEGILQLAEQGGSFDWLAEEPDLYCVEDLKERYR